MASAMEQSGEKPAAEAEDCGEVRDQPQAAEKCFEDRIRLLLSKIEDLENEIEDVKSNFEMKNLALNRMKLSAALRHKLEKMGAESSVLTDDMKQILKLQKLIMKSQEGLILGSQINWAEDSALKEIVLQLEKDLTTI
ncbi:hypothetical protein U0070_027052 [Myodes glareolus]|uniref:Centromere protein H C-terminal domain-containing protein n=1 Tax=Myodes glareolus TaxID=447135 RepID=A0AAW0HMM5_MYOGA